VGEGRTDRPGPNQQRVTVREAAVLLGISEGAVRMRVKRGTLPSTREGGRLYVLLNTELTTEPERPHDGTHDRTSELIATLREQLQAERQAHAEARRIIAGLVERIPAIEAPQEVPESPEAGEEQYGRGEPHPVTGGAQQGVRRPWRSLWRRVLGG
jgi:excisionase family DNA binding protein